MTRSKTVLPCIQASLPFLYVRSYRYYQGFKVFSYFIGSFVPLLLYSFFQADSFRFVDFMVAWLFFWTFYEIGYLWNDCRSVRRESLASYRARFRELEQAVDEAQELGRPEQAERHREERDALARELRSAVGLGGRGRCDSIGEPGIRAVSGQWMLRLSFAGRLQVDRTQPLRNLGHRATAGGRNDGTGGRSLRRRVDRQAGLPMPDEYCDGRATRVADPLRC